MVSSSISTILQRSRNMIFVQSMMSLLFLCTLSGNMMAASAHNHTHNKTPLYFSFITTLTGTFISSGAIPIVDKALDQINSRTDILENYTLNYTTVLDSKCSSSPSLNAFFDHFNNRSQPTYITSLCCGCTTATIPVAEISHQWNIPHVSFAGAASFLSDQERFRTFFQLLPSTDDSADAYAKIFAKFGWTQVLMVTLQESLFTSITNDIKAKSEKQGIVVHDVPIQLGDYPYDNVFNTIIDGNYRVMILRMYGSYVISHLCEAHRRNMKYPDYVYITYGGFTQEWWKRYPESTLPCSHSAIEEMVIGSLSTLPKGYLPTQDKVNNTTSFGQNIDTFLDEYRSLLKLPQYSHYPESGLVGVAYDAIWSIALGLDIAAKRIAVGNDSGCDHLSGNLVPLEQFDYYNQRLGCIMVQSMEEVTFTGVTRDFNLINRGTADKRIRSLYQERLQSDGRVSKKLVGFADDNSSNPLQLLPDESTQTLWGLSKPPYDGASVKRFIPVHIALQVVAYVLAFCGFIFVLVCFIFSLVFRKKKIIKLASPKLNYIVLGGSVMLFLSVFLYAYSTNDDYSNIEIYTGICNVEFLLFSLGYTSCFAVILSKQWRIYYIFNKPTSKKKTIRDWHLLIIIIVIVVMDLLILVVGMSMDNLRLKAEIIPHYNDFITTSREGIRQMNFVLQCNSKDAFVWLLVSFIYKGSLQILAIFMAFHTRKVKIKALNDSKEITAIIYISSIVLILLAVTEFVFVSFVEIFAALFSLGVIIQACIFTGVIFIPKMIGMYLDPEGDHIFRESSEIRSDRASSFIEAKMGGGGNNDVNELKTRIALLERQLNEQPISPELATSTACNDSVNHVPQIADC